MKKAKVMLAVIAVFAIVGGALAFRAKTVNQLKFCTLPSDASAFACVANQGIVNSTFTASPIAADNAVTFYYTAVDDLATCDEQQCANSTTFKADPAN